MLAGQRVVDSLLL